ncbi:BioY family protein [Arthrobacter crystallopoietes BAB-32]|uniref:Biotin transporter n=1 Tax=Arthrobacter crystallopoietes BAB-32 TaxID=1246476 RepID=N1V751_9MICC|nr:biotin transporter BioY [Arthrobacter crystallopoietes]EMY35937.1 BioY family protein [Arthrobacter crystallopoietes BAB-32]
MPASEDIRSSTSAASAAAPATGARRRRSWNGTDLALIAVFAALTAASVAVPPIPAGNVLGVPITLQTMIVALAGLVLGGARALAAVGLYVLLGLVGLPIFAGFQGGLGVLAAGSAGYLLSFPFTAGLIGVLAGLVLRRSAKVGTLTTVWLFLAATAGTLLTHALGVAGMMLNGQLALPAALVADLPFIPGDLVKNAVAAAVALSLHKAFPDLLRRRRR